MIFHGFQKLTLLDFPGKVACTLFTGGCNLRCPFCHNATLVLDPDAAERYTEEEILAFLEKRRGLLDGVALTGGEPLLGSDVAPFLQKVKDLGFAVKLDTNGTFPDKLRALVSAGLVDYVAMDLKNCPDRYAETVGVPGFRTDKIRESIDFLLSGSVDYEFRTTVVSGLHTVADIRAAAEWIRGAKRYFLQNFVDSGNLLSEGLSSVGKETLEEMKNVASVYVPGVSVRGI